ncbi:Bdr family repetitive protein [Candidatus Borreliella tachyglossi]|uniref:Bdr family repetitive protein n=1 Tax=Candidatus Borreliella tachyglossi TaxID=1964448 RepID=UPI0040421763
METRHSQEYLQNHIIITEDMMAEEFTRMGMNKDIAYSFVKSHFHNNITRKDLDLLKMELKSDIALTNSKIDNLEVTLNSKIDMTNSKIDNLEATLNSKIDMTNSKIDNLEATLNSKIDNLEVTLNSKIDLFRTEINSRIDKSIAVVEGKINTLWWMFGTIVAFFITILGVILFR